MITYKFTAKCEGCGKKKVAAGEVFTGAGMVRRYNLFFDGLAGLGWKLDSKNGLWVKCPGCRGAFLPQANVHRWQADQKAYPGWAAVAGISGGEALNKLIVLILVCLAGAAAAWADGEMELAKSLGLIGGVLLVALAFLVLLRGALDDADTPKPKSNPPGRDPGPDIVEYPDPPENAPRLPEPRPGHYAERGGMLEPGRHALPPMRREPASRPEAPIEVEPDTIFAPRAREKK